MASVFAFPVFSRLLFLARKRSHAAKDFLTPPQERERLRPARESELVRAHAKALAKTEKEMVRHAGASDGETGGAFSGWATLVLLAATAPPAATLAYYRLGGAPTLFATLSAWMFFGFFFWIKLIFDARDRESRKKSKPASDWSKEHARLWALCQAQTEALALAEALWRADQEAIDAQSRAGSGNACDVGSLRAGSSGSHGVSTTPANAPAPRRAARRI